jgi:hypothetical protein
MTEPVALFGLPNISDLLGKLPGLTELQKLKADFDDFVAAVDKVTAYVTEYSWVPGASTVLAPLQGLDKGLQLVQKLIDFVPS